jgi:hypothetical protein
MKVEYAGVLAYANLNVLCHGEESATKHLSPSLPYEGREKGRGASPSLAMTDDN